MSGSFYERRVLPPILDLVMRQRQLAKYRRAVAAAARGRVLEIGVGSGLNFSHYRDGVDIVFGVDPSARLLAMARRRAASAGVRAQFVQGSATALPFADRSVDTAIMTWTLCSIPEPMVALGEIRRVLRPGGAFVFVEHGLSPDAGVARWQERLTPVWRHLAGGCHLNRKTDDLVRAAGFAFTSLETEYAEGPRLMTYMYRGSAG